MSVTCNLREDGSRSFPPHVPSFFIVLGNEGFLCPLKHYRAFNLKQMREVHNAVTLTR